MRFPRTIVLTDWAPDGKYAGAEALRRLLRALPQNQIRWVSLKGVQKAISDLPAHRAFPVRRLHWRMADCAADCLFRYEVQARRVARQIADWNRDFQAEVIWTLPELGAINVAWHLHRLLRIPLHATAYDCLESARDICLPALYYPLYMRRVRRLFGALASVDAVSPELLAHIRESYGLGPRCLTLSMAPSIPASWIQPIPSRRGAQDSNRVRLIGVCGAFRGSVDQWKGFLGFLGNLPYRIEIISFGWGPHLDVVALPRNVVIRKHAYMENERDVIEWFANHEVDAFYLGLRTDSAWGLFARTSLSSKLVTYTAAARPIIVDGPSDSVAWRLVGQYGAGMLLDGTEASRKDLMRLFSDEPTWLALAQGAHRLCVEQFNLNANIKGFAELLAQSAARIVS